MHGGYQDLYDLCFSIQKQPVDGADGDSILRPILGRRSVCDQGRQDGLLQLESPFEGRRLGKGRYRYLESRSDEFGVGIPCPAGFAINSKGNEYYPTLADNGTIYFGSTRDSGKGGSDIYRCALVNGQHAAAENLGDSINTVDNEFEPFIAPDESYLIFMATIPQGLTNGDLYFSNNIDGQWSKAEKLPAPFNSTGTEWSPKVTRDGQYFFFSSARSTQSNSPPKTETIEQLTKRLRHAGNGLADVYQVDFSAVKILMNRPQK